MMPRLKYDTTTGLGSGGGNANLQRAIVQAAMLPDRDQDRLVDELRAHPGVLERVLAEREPMLSGGPESLEGLGFTPGIFAARSMASGGGVNGLFKNLGNFFEKVYKSGVKGLRKVGPIAAPIASVIHPAAGALVSAATMAAGPGPMPAGQMGPQAPYQTLAVPNIYGGLSPSLMPPPWMYQNPTQAAAEKPGIDKNLLVLGGLALVVILLK